MFVVVPSGVADENHNGVWKIDKGMDMMSAGAGGEKGKSEGFFGLSLGPKYRPWQLRGDEMNDQNERA